MKRLIFIFGLPRSGTKLLRNLLNNHPNISIPEVETHFIPFLHRKYANITSFTNDTIIEIYEDLKKTSFFRINNENGVSNIEIEDIKSAKPNNFKELIFHILNFYSLKDKKESLYIGDKTPGYINNIDTISQIFPEAYFIHIVRDPRDYCLSVNKAWGKNIYRASIRWQEQINKLNCSSNNLRNFYEIKYEDLVSQPRNSLFRVIKYLNLEFNEELLKLRTVTENYGDAKDQKEIINNNFNKFLSRLKCNQIKKIEGFTYKGLGQYGYITHCAQKTKPVNRYSKILYYIEDVMQILLFGIKKRGFIEGIKFIINYQKFSSWD